MSEFGRYDRSFRYSAIFYTVLTLDLFVASFALSRVITTYFATGNINSHQSLAPVYGIILAVNLLIDFALMAKRIRTPIMIDTRICWLKTLFAFIGIVTFISFFYFIIISLDMRSPPKTQQSKKSSPEQGSADTDKTAVQNLPLESQPVSGNEPKPRREELPKKTAVPSEVSLSTKIIILAVVVVLIFVGVKMFLNANQEPELLKGQTVYQGPVPNLTQITYETKEGDSITTDYAFKGWITLLVSKTTSEKDVQDFVTSHDGKIIDAIPSVGIYTVQVKGGNEAKMISDLLKQAFVVDAAPTTPVVASDITVIDEYSRLSGVPGYSTCENDHGTHVAAVAKRGGGSVDTIPVAWGELEKPDYYRSIITAMAHGKNTGNRRIISLSVQSGVSGNVWKIFPDYDNCLNTSGDNPRICRIVQANQKLLFETIFQTFEYAPPELRDNTIVALSAGNGASDLTGIINKLRSTYPNAARSIVIVGGTDQNGDISLDFNYASPDTPSSGSGFVFAPAVDITTTGGTECSGTSFATPEVARILDEMWRVNPDLTSEELMKVFDDALATCEGAEPTKNIVPQTSVTDTTTKIKFIDCAALKAKKYNSPTSTQTTQIPQSKNTSRSTPAPIQSACRSGLERTSTSNGNCCPIGYGYYYDDQCNACPHDYPHSYGEKCHKCKEGFSVYTSSDGHCCPEAAPYYWDDQCQSCAKENYQGGLCQNCGSGYRKFDTSRGHCCPIGYPYYDNGRCSTQPAQGAVYYGDTSGEVVRVSSGGSRMSTSSGAGSGEYSIKVIYGGHKSYAGFWLTGASDGSLRGTSTDTFPVTNAKNNIYLQLGWDSEYDPVSGNGIYIPITVQILKNGVVVQEGASKSAYDGPIILDLNI